MKRIIYILLLSFITSCSKTEYTIENINNNHITIMGHGGMGISSNYPLDAMESILKSLATGAEGTEMDVQMTKDSVLVLFHDTEMDNNTTLSGLINDHTWEEIQASHYSNLPYDNYKIVSLEDVFEAIDDPLSYTFTFDCKLIPGETNANDYTTLFASQVINFLLTKGLNQNVIIEASSKDFITFIKANQPNFRILYYPSSFEEGLSWATSMDLYGITISTSNITKEQITEAHSNNLFVATWNTHSRKLNREAILKNPDMIQTDRLKYLLKELEQ